LTLLLYHHILCPSQNAQDLSLDDVIKAKRSDAPRKKTMVAGKKSAAKPGACF
jgi:hypothetical protein